LIKSLTGAKANRMRPIIVVHTASHQTTPRPAAGLPVSDLSWSQRIQLNAAATPNAVGSSQPNLPSNTAVTSSVLSNVTSVAR
jgi:hypothetical protein